MLHRSVDHSLVANNIVRNNGREGGTSHGGIVLFESDHNIIRDNIVDGNPNGIRFSVGASHNLIENNTVTNSTRYGVYFFKSQSDAPERCDGLMRSNTFKNNQISGSAESAIRLKDSDKNLFRNNIIPEDEIRLSSARNNMFVDNELDSDLTFVLDGDGDTDRSSFLILAGDDDFNVRAEDGSNFTVVGGAP